MWPCLPPVSYTHLADWVLSNLHEESLSLSDHLLNRAILTIFLSSPFNIEYVQEGRALKPDVDEGRLHTGQHPKHLTDINVADKSATGGAFDMKILQHSCLLYTSFAQAYAQGALPLLELYTGEEPLFETQQVEAELQRALDRRVPLKSGGYIVVDCTEAMTTVDVNTGGFVGKRDFSETVFKTNLERCV